MNDWETLSAHIYCWGAGRHGQLGNGAFLDSNVTFLFKDTGKSLKRCVNRCGSGEDRPTKWAWRAARCDVRSMYSKVSLSEDKIILVESLKYTPMLPFASM